MNCLKILLRTKAFHLINDPEYCGRLSCLQIQIRRHSNHKKFAENLTETDLNLDLSVNRSGDQLIYSGPESMVRMIKTIKMFSISTTLIAAGVQPFIFQKILATNSSSFAIGFAVMTSAGIVLSPLLLNWLTKRYVTQLYYNYDKEVFTAWYLSLLCRRASVQYRASDVSVPETLGMFTTFTIGDKKRPLFVDPEFVTDFSVYKHMLGYDKPLDIKFNKILDNVQQNEHKIK